jgi:serine/threonine protein kinase
MLVREMRNQRLFVMKILTSEDPGLLERYCQSLRGMAPCEFMAKVLNVFWKEGHLYIIMDYLNNGDLLKTLTHRLNEPTARFFLAELIIGLQHWYAQFPGFHKLLSPHNILLDSQNHLKLAHYGLFTPLSQRLSVSPFSGSGLNATAGFEEDETATSNKPAHKAAVRMSSGLRVAGFEEDQTETSSKESHKVAVWKSSGLKVAGFEADLNATSHKAAVWKSSGLRVAGFEEDQIETSSKEFLKVAAVWKDHLADHLGFYPPEVLLGRDPDEKSDCWVIGVWLYELLSGKHLVKAETDGDFHEYLNEETEICGFQRGFSPESEDLIRKLTRKKRDLRLSLAEVRQHEFLKEVDWEKVSSREGCGPLINVSRKAHHKSDFAGRR